MNLSSLAFKNNEEIPKQYTCLGKNINPPLTITDIADNTKSFVLFLEDITATPTLWVHWLLFDIPKIECNILENSIPVGAIEGLSNNHSFGYEGHAQHIFLVSIHMCLRCMR